MTAAPRGFWLVSACYQAFTLSDGALRMLVLLHLGAQGRAPLALALALLPYELAGVFTNLLGGWLGARFGLKPTLLAGLLAQAAACCLLAAEPTVRTYALLAVAQCLSGVAKDLTKTSAKSYVRRLAPADAGAAPLFRLVAWLTGSKNAVKGAGYFVGGALLAGVGFAATNVAIAALLGVAAVAAALRVPAIPSKPRTTVADVVRQPAAVRWLAVSRTFLFGARDVWFAVALPLFLATAAGLSSASVGACLAAWIVVYGLVQAATPRLTGARDLATGTRHAALTAALLAAPLGALVVALDEPAVVAAPLVPLGLGFVAFGALFAVVSSLHSWLVVAVAGAEDAAERVGFYYAANSLGRLAGTLASGWLYGLATTPVAGLQACLLVATGASLIGAATLLPLRR
ncbi:MAG: MFS transporter [Planctomycetes bacterium]|nr:MFS transporter [Planctomycetota bacterium]